MRQKRNSNSPAFKALRGVVTDKLLLKTLPHLTKFCHTGELDIFHSMLLKYCPKRQHFHYESKDYYFWFSCLSIPEGVWPHLLRRMPFGCADLQVYRSENCQDSLALTSCGLSGQVIFSACLSANARIFLLEITGLSTLW